MDNRLNLGKRKINWLDILLLILLGLSALTGLMKGLVSSVFSIGGLALGLTFAGKYHDDLAGRLTFISPEKIAKIAAFITIMLVVFIVMAILAWLVKKLVHSITLGWLDHMAGAAFGLLFGGYFLGALLAVLLRFSFFLPEDIIKDSGIAQFLLNLPFIGEYRIRPPQY